MFPPPVMLLSSVKDVRMPRLRTAMTTPRTGTVRRWFSGRAWPPAHMQGFQCQGYQRAKQQPCELLGERWYAG